MGFLLKAAFWLTVLLLLIPTGGENAGKPGSVGAVDALSAAQAVFDDTSGFCGRQPDACQFAERFTASLSDKALAGAKMLYEFLREHADKGASHNGPAPAPAPDSAESAPAAPMLAPAEREVPWRGPEGPRPRG